MGALTTKIIQAMPPMGFSELKIIRKSRDKVHGKQIWLLTRLQALFGGGYQSSRTFAMSDTRVHVPVTQYYTTALLFTLFIRV